MFSCRSNEFSVSVSPANTQIFQSASANQILSLFDSFLFACRMVEAKNQ